MASEKKDLTPGSLPKEAVRKSVAEEEAALPTSVPAVPPVSGPAPVAPTSVVAPAPTAVSASAPVAPPVSPVVLPAPTHTVVSVSAPTAAPVVKPAPVSSGPKTAARHRAPAAKPPAQPIVLPPVAFPTARPESYAHKHGTALIAAFVIMFVCLCFTAAAIFNNHRESKTDQVVTTQLSKGDQALIDQLAAENKKLKDDLAVKSAIVPTPAAAPVIVVTPEPVHNNDWAAVEDSMSRRLAVPAVSRADEVSPPSVPQIDRSTAYAGKNRTKIVSSEMNVQVLDFVTETDGKRVDVRALAVVDAFGSPIVAEPGRLAPLLASSVTAGLQPGWSLIPLQIRKTESGQKIFLPVWVVDWPSGVQSK